MKIVNVGPDEVELSEIVESYPNATVVVYDYERGDWDGDGWAVIRFEDGWNIIGLGHCSCFGPFDKHVEGTAVFDTLDEAVSSYSMDPWEVARFNKVVEAARTL